MPFSEELRNELAAVEPTSRCDVLAELSGLFHGAGRVHLRGRGEIALHLDLPSSAVARRAFSLLRTLGIPSEIRTYRRHAFQQATRYELHVAGRPAALELLREAGVISARGAPLERPPTRLVARPCCRGAYLRGALLAAGSLSGPSAPHLEIRASGVDGARFLAAVAAADGAHLAVLERARHAVAYAKGSEPIEQVLAAAGAGGAVLALEERAVVAATRNRANRLANADHANLVRAGRAAHAQLQAVRRLQRAGVLDDLPERLRDAAELRRRHPSLSLAELAARTEPRVTKATLYRRLAKVVEVADETTAD